ncbi:MAG: nickel pincer cofactor biosynthesis protein LarB [Armatimonadetes bacterium]|jgi:NCAIR mutase (PurE)-related protein|nr:nickel pincer cofactor biosynthesis protein LarB [Armatimonadota bacterium]
MDLKLLRQLLEDIKTGEIAVDDAMRRLRSLPYEDIGFAKLDNHRRLRNGVAEVVFCQGKTTSQIIEILQRLSAQNSCVLATRCDKEVYESVKSHIPDSTFYEAARIIVTGSPERSEPELASDKKYVMTLCGGTADIPIAEEAAVTATALGSRVERAYDVGVAGLHRLLDQKDRILGANVLIVLAGMEGALASVVGGLVDRPVIAVPTSVGYGASFGGLAALLAMLNSCAAGVSVVNIDNGFGAGYLAHMINDPQN